LLRRKQINVYNYKKSNFNEIILKESQTYEVIVIATKLQTLLSLEQSHMSMVAGYVKANNVVKKQ
jgi:hypothetical protein